MQKDARVSRPRVRNRSVFYILFVMRTSSLCVSLDRANEIEIMAESMAPHDLARGGKEGRGIKGDPRCESFIAGNSALIADRARK